MELIGNRTAIYCRLSRDDGNEESSSIQSQKEVLSEYASSHNLKIVDYYIDDGFSGTNFERPGFIRLINDIESNLIDVVITKDLSRLGRNYIQTGYYLEDYFPNNNIRYIAVNDNFDTFKEDGNDFAPFKNIINEWYAKDISKKIRFTLDSKAKRGECKNTVFPLFGYQYNSSYERIPDPYTGKIVQDIFQKYLETGSSVKVAKYLIENKVRIPSYYNALKYNYNKEKVLEKSDEQLINWRPHNIREILRNIEYTGVYITAKRKTKNFKDKKIQKNKNPYYFENRFPALIDKETFEKVNFMLDSSRAGIVPIDDNIFKGMLICSSCHRPLRFSHARSSKNGKSLDYYHCFHNDCSERNVIKKEFLCYAIKEELLNLKKIILSHSDEFIEFANYYDRKKTNIKRIDNSDLMKLKKRDAELDNYIKALFEQNMSRRIPDSTYNSMVEKYAREKDQIERQISLITIDEQKTLVQKTSENQAIQFVKKLEEINESNVLQPDNIRAYIKNITVKTTHIKGSQKYIWDLRINYFKLDEIIKEFVSNEYCCNIC